MKLKEETVKKLGQIIKEDYGVEIAYEKVSEIAHGLTGYFDLLAKMYHGDIESREALAL